MDAKKRQSPSSGCRGCLRILGRWLVGFALFLVILAVAGYGWEQVASAQDRRRYPPPGKLIEVNHHKLHLYCVGSGSPTILLEAQATSSSVDWGYVQPQLAEITRTCAYDRAGFAWSEPGTPPRTAQQAANELHELLEAAGETGPFILVGASYGGHIVRIFAHDYPTEVQGVVLVDARPEKLYSIPKIQDQSRASLASLRVITFLGDCGLSRLFLATMKEKLIPAYAVPHYNAHPGSFEIVFQSKLWHAIYEEALIEETSDAQVAAIETYGDLPLIVLRHGKPMFASLPEQEAQDMEQKWAAFQTEIASKSSNGQVIVAENSGHGIQFEQPSVVIEAVQQLLVAP
jgi:pimeloyl-ACP methyl ester carboxylesterase